MDFRPGSAIGPNGVVFTNPQDSGLGNFSIVGLPEIGLFIPSRSLLATNLPLFSCLACAVKAKAQHIVTRDKDLLDLGHYHTIEIVSPEDFLTVLRSDES
jgi:hypothetical protein